MFSILCLLAASVICHHASLLAAPPEVKYLYPAGGQQGQQISVQAAGTFANWPVEIWVDRPGIEVAADEKKGQLTVKLAADALPGVAWIRLIDAQGAAAARPFLVGTLDELLEQEPNDAPNKPQVLSSSCVLINGQVSKTGDVDTFAVSLRAGQTVVASMEANRTLASPMDGVLQIVSADGFVLAQNDDEHGLDPLVVFTAPSDGNYLVRTFAFPAKPNSSVRLSGAADYVYRLSISTGPFVDFTRPLAVPASEEPTPSVALVGWNLPPHLQTLVPSAIADPASRLVWHQELGNALWLPVVNGPAAIEEPPSDSSQPNQQTLSVPGCITGQIALGGELDRYRFAAKKGEKIRFQVAARELGYPLDPYLAIEDDAGKQLSANDDRSRELRDAELTFTVPRDGEFVVSVRDLHRHGGPRYAYRLTAIPVKADFALTVAADGFVLNAGKPLEIPVTVARKDGFAELIEIAAEGLPKGVTAKMVPSPAKGAEAKLVKLSLSADKGPAAGVFRIVGRVPDKPEQTRTAQASVVGGATLAELWLTVVKKP